MSIEIRNVTFFYNAGSVLEKKALDDISLKIDAGEFVGLIGHTGSGKSTLAQHMNGLLRPSRGQVLIGGEDIHADKSRLKQVRRRVGLVFQYPEHQLFEMTVFKDVAFGPENMGWTKAETEAAVISALELAGIEKELYEQPPFELSGGQKRRVAIAGVLAMRPEILLLDEPAAGLDPRGRDEILDKIKEMHQQLGITVILVSHSMEDISRLVSRIIVMDSGRIAQSGAPGEIFARVEELERIGLAAPQISYIMRELKERGFDVPTDIFTVKEAVKAITAAFIPLART
ncbi:MAG: energy-coupling factor transporter ATPase [Clostridiales bacterium]|jgi:energy-coupling factor transport system ATP-binding protein|nr:energy-coupling factor transporter ATPase [Clostridiales bacterium]